MMIEIIDFAPIAVWYMHFDNDMCHNFKETRRAWRRCATVHVPRLGADAACVAQGILPVLLSDVDEENTRTPTGTLRL